MMLANKVAVGRHMLSKKYEVYVREMLLRPILQVDGTLKGIDNSRIIEAMKKDKKRTGTGLALVMMKDGPDMVQVKDLSEAEAVQALDAQRK
jgi:3-dehydroquinate synthetase